MTADPIRAASFTNKRQQLLQHQLPAARCQLSDLSCQLWSCYVRQLTVTVAVILSQLSALGCQLSSSHIRASIPLSQLSAVCLSNQSQWQQLQNIRCQSMASAVGAVKYQPLVSVVTFKLSADHTHNSHSQLSSTGTAARCPISASQIGEGVNSFKRIKLM